MKIYGLIGFPVKHSYSAAMHNAAFKELGINARYELFEISPANLEEGFKTKLAQGVCGFNVTIPYKEQIIKFLDELDEEAEFINAVNTIKVSAERVTEGFNTDGLGFITYLTQVVGASPYGKSISILGAGGAAKAVATQLARAQAKNIYLCDIDQNKAKELADKLGLNFPACRCQVVAQADALLQIQPDILINATPVGMRRGDPLVFDPELLHPKMMVFDLIYNPAQTPLLQQAKRKRCLGVFNGLGMLLYQGVLAFKLLLGLKPPVAVMERALKEMLDKEQ